MNKVILQEFEYLLKAKEAKPNSDDYRHYFDRIKKDLGAEYADNIDDKIKRWIDITHYEMLSESKPVEFYIQAKMLYRDGFYDAAIVIGRSICEMFCYDYLGSVPNQYDSLEEIEKKNFRELINYIFIPKQMPGDFFEKFNTEITVLEKDFLHRFFEVSDDKIIFKNTKKSEHLSKIITILKKCLPENFWIQYDLLNSVYDIGNDYVHPKANKNSKSDSEILLNKIGQVLFGTYGIHTIDEMIGKVVKTAYLNYPDICKCNNLLIEIFANPESAKKN